MFFQFKLTSENIQSPKDAADLLRKLAQDIEESTHKHIYHQLIVEGDGDEVSTGGWYFRKNGDK